MAAEQAPVEMEAGSINSVNSHSLSSTGMPGPANHPDRNSSGMASPPGRIAASEAFHQHEFPVSYSDAVEQRGQRN